VQANSSEAKALETKLEKPINREYSLADLLKRPELKYFDICNLKGLTEIDEEAAEQVEIQAKYAGYIDRQTLEIERLRRYENTQLPVDFDFNIIEGLSNEVKQKLTEARPETLARASRIPGVTPAAVSLLLIYLKKRGVLGKKIA
jgi:tRNA uridine 5-carboxymethylaminomethyl modification enzyme